MSPFLPPTRASPSTLLSLLLSQVERRRESCGGRDPLINNWICERTYLPFQTSNLRFPSFLFLPFICDLRPCMIYDVSPPASPPFSFSGLNTFQSVLFALSGREDEQPSSAVQIHSVDQSGGHSLPAACTGQASRQALHPPTPFPLPHQVAFLSLPSSGRSSLLRLGKSSENLLVRRDGLLRAVPLDTKTGCLEMEDLILSALPLSLSLSLSLSHRHASCSSSSPLT